MSRPLRLGCKAAACVASLAIALGVFAEEGVIADGVADCHDEGKDPLCGHLKATLARFLAEDPRGVQEADHQTDVTHCLLDIALDPVAKTISGTCTLTVTSLAPGLTQFTVDLRDNMVVDGVVLGGSPAVYSRPGHTIEITLDRPYGIGEAFQVAVTYHGSPQKLGYGSFDWSTHNGTVVASSLSEPWYAHTWWPCKDSLGDKFTADIRVTVPGWMVVASNGTLEGIDALPDGRRRYRWHEGSPIITYLVSLAATNYVTWTEYYSHAGGAMPVQFFAYPESESSVRSGTTDLVTQIGTFSRPDVFGEYPFVGEKYGLAQFPWSGGMEHQTITSQGVFNSWLNAHELAHQWWGDDVTCGTWHDIWLNEGFATFAEAVYQEKRPGGTLQDYLNWMRSTRWPSDHSGTVYVYDAASLGAVFNSNTVYKKGAWVVHMLRHVLGDEVFFDALAAYRAAFAGGSAVTADLQGVIEAVSDRDLAWFFNEWVYGPGSPSYRWGWQQEQIGSQRYVRLHVEQTQTAYPVFVMPVDVTLTTGAGTTTRAIWNDAAWQWYLLPANGTVTNVQFDKDTWILRGAATNVTYVPGPPKLIGTSPGPGAILPGSPEAATITLRFSQAIQCAPEDFVIAGQRTGVAASVFAYDPSSYTVTLSIADGLPANDTYVLTVRDTVQSAGKALDGEVSDPSHPDSLPSGDGKPGGTASIRFSTACYGDFDLDRDVDLEDFSRLQACFTGPNRPILPGTGCETSADADRDRDVDLADFAAFQACFNGPNRPAACI